MPLPVSETRTCVASAIACGFQRQGSVVVHGLYGVGNEIDEHMEKLIGVPLHHDVRLIQLTNVDILERHGIAGDLESLVQLAVDANQAVLP